jgi:subtilase family serine protease
MRFSRARRVGTAATAVLAVAVGGVLATGPAAQAATPSAPAIRAHQITVDPLSTWVGRPAADAILPCQNVPLHTPGKIRCYVPSQLQAAYGVTPLLQRGFIGKGRTIVIVDAYSNPGLPEDLANFNAVFGLPAAQVTTVAPNGVPAFDPTNDEQVGWASESSLDVQWAHAIAPGAKIVLVQAKSSADLDIYNATKYAVDHNLGDVISQSFGEAESCVDPKLEALQHTMFQAAAAKGITLFASSGDQGAAQPSCDGTGWVFQASSPASDPYVTAVGGTTLNATLAGKYVGESSWSDQDSCPGLTAPKDGCSGGGFSAIYPQPSYQKGIPNTRAGARGVPDVAYNAGADGGVIAWCSVCGIALGASPTQSAFVFSGTSAGSPQWAALIAIANQLAGKRVGQINPTLYAASRVKAVSKLVFHDITTGNNIVKEINGQGYKALGGWDPVTGLGTPQATALLPLLAGVAHL